MPSDSEDADRRRAEVHDLEVIGDVPILLRAKPLDKPALQRALSAIRRQRDREATMELDWLAAEVQAALADTRVAARASEVERLGRKSPTRLAILWVLASGPVTRKELGQRISVDGTTVSRTLKALKGEQLVEVEVIPSDKRTKLLRLSEAGEHHAADATTYGRRPDVLLDVHSPELSEFLCESLDAAVKLRREVGQRDDVLARIESIGRTAEAENLWDIWLDAANERLTTLRQYGRTKEFGRELRRFTKDRQDERRMTTPHTVLASFGCLQYQRGRQGSDELELELLAGYLTTACSAFDELASGGRERWREHQGRATVALADNLRRRGDAAAAVETALDAREIFARLDNNYGLARSYFLVGFCLRLLGDFHSALIQLNRAYTLSVEHGYQPFIADSLVQIGEVQRCLGALDEARELLEQGATRAGELGLTLAQAFAKASLAALAYERAEDDEGLVMVREAAKLFKRRKFAQGTALANRREARILIRGRQDLDHAATLVRSAAEIYRDEKSLSGCAACWVDAGDIALARNEMPQKAVDRLLRLVRNETATHEFKRDFWLPQMLLEFAERAEPETSELHDVAEALRQSGEQVRENLLASNADRLREAADDSPAVNDENDEADEDATQIPTERVEMGGEHRPTPTRTLPISTTAIEESESEPSWLKLCSV